MLESSKTLPVVVVVPFLCGSGSGYFRTLGINNVKPLFY